MGLAPRGQTMGSRHNLARVLGPPLLVTLASACGARSDLTSSSAHDAGALPFDGAVLAHDAGGAGADAGLGSDAGAGADAGGPLPGTCELTRDGIDVELIPVSTAVLCAYGHHEGAVISSVSAEPATDGLRLRADFCPDADADCRCDIVITGAGRLDVARLPFPRAALTIDVDHQHLVVRKAPTCRCDGCGCDMFLAFVASHEDPDTARDLPPEISFARGSVICPTTGGCDRTDSYGLRVRTLGFDVELAEGAEETLGPVVVRSVRDAVGWDTCAACADCGAVRGSFVAWVDAPFAGP